MSSAVRELIDNMITSGDVDIIIKEVLFDVTKNIMLYGADNTGVVDVSYIVRKLVSQGVSEIYFPVGNYLFDTDELFENVSFIGKRINQEKTTTFIIRKPIVLNSISNDGVKTIKNIKFVAYDETSHELLVIGAGTWGARYKIENCKFVSFNHTAVKCLSNFSTEFKDCLFQDNGTDTNIGIELTSNDEPNEKNFNNEIIVNNCYFNNSYDTKQSTCIKADNVRGLSIKNSSFEWSKCAIYIGRLAVNISVDTCWFEQLGCVFNKPFNINTFKDSAVYQTDYLFDGETNINDGFTIPKINGTTLAEAMENAKDFMYPYASRIRYSVNNKYHEVINEGYASKVDYRPTNQLNGTKLTKSVYYDTTKLKETGLKYLVIATARKTFDTNTSTAISYGLVSKDFVVGIETKVKNTNSSENSKILNISFQADGVSVSLIDENDADFTSCTFIPLGI